MTSEQRLHALRATHESSLRIALPLEIVRQLDEFLWDYGISEPLADEDLDERVRFVLNRGEAKKFLRVLEARNTAYALGEGTQRVDLDFSFIQSGRGRSRRRGRAIAYRMASPGTTRGMSSSRR